MMNAPIISPTLSSTSIASDQSTGPSVVRRLSSSSVIADLLLGTSSPSPSIQFADGDVDVVTESGLAHAQVKLEAKLYKSSAFATQLLKTVRNLSAPTWSSDTISSQDLKVHKVSGSLTNAVFFISCPASPGTRTLLLRIYGPSSGSLISRPRELHTLHMLSSRYRIGPRVYGTFENGRVEEYFDSTTLSASDLRDPTISQLIGARMAELHSVDIEVVEDDWHHKECELGAKKNVRSWLPFAEDVLALPQFPDVAREELNLKAFRKEWARYIQWLDKVDDVHKGSRRVFSHNDTQYGNLLRLTDLKEGLPAHRQIIVVDFEYASPNPASFDIANHFHEWTADYHSSTAHILQPNRYPTLEERHNFYLSYLKHVPREEDAPIPSKESLENEIQLLDEQVRFWSPASHAMWAVWGIVQAREDVQGDVQEPEFDYIGYARCRMAGFRGEIRALGL